MLVFFADGSERIGEFRFVIDRFRFKSVQKQIKTE
jgi:hypothetical protein